MGALLEAQQKPLARLGTGGEGARAFSGIGRWLSCGRGAGPAVGGAGAAVRVGVLGVAQRHLRQSQLLSKSSRHPGVNGLPASPLSGMQCGA